MFARTNPLLTNVEQDNQNEWFADVLKHNNGFIEDVKQWSSETRRQISHTYAHLGTKEVPITVSQQEPTHIEMSNVHPDENESHLSKHFG